MTDLRVADQATYEVAWIASMTPYWHVVARSADVGSGDVVGVTLLGRRLALWRTPDGALGLIDEQCPHRGVALSLGAVTDDGCLRCPYHAWTFDTSGACTEIPQLPGRILPGSSVGGYAVEEAYGFVWACLADEPARPRVAFPALDDDTHWFWMGEPIDWKAQNLRQIENFSDVSHFSVLHVDTFGNPTGTSLEPTAAVRDDWQLGFQFPYPAMDPTTPPAPDKVGFPMVFDYLIELPCSVLLGGASGPGSVMFVHSTPVDVYEARVYWGTAFPHGVEIDEAEYADIEDRIWRPDMAIVESQRPRGLPVDVVSERHLPQDRCSVSYRRALADIGIPAPR
ncbi:MAG: Rieske (2Fe-2S) iron-sulfur domain protein [Ilumatobacteraceae bacterium]|nr:Rieske (2Fe-2S) iron-sulfur domain protein [Ilumatobacteraceae bacterium]